MGAGGAVRGVGCELGDVCALVTVVVGVAVGCWVVAVVPSVACSGVWVVLAVRKATCCAVGAG